MNAINPNRFVPLEREGGDGGGGTIARLSGTLTGLNPSYQSQGIGTSGVSISNLRPLNPNF